MNPIVRTSLEAAAWNIHAGWYDLAITELRYALKYCSDRRAWSKIMLALRALSRIAPTVDRTS